MNSKGQIVRDGAVAGLLGAATVALWFLLFDFSRGRMFETPALLASVLFHSAARGAALPLVVEYTIVHVFAFVAFGVGTAIMLEAAEHRRTLLPALLIVLIAFEGLFVALVTFLGPEFQSALSWWSVLVGNLLATAVMVAYFFGRHPRLGDRLFGPWVSILAEGAAAGAIGGTVVILWFLFYDVGSGSNPFRTPATLGSVILAGSRNPATIAATSPVVMSYTVLHFAVFVAFGIVVASLAASLEEPLLWLCLLLVFSLFQAFFMGFASILSDALLNQLGWGTIVVGNLLSAAAMLAFFYARRRSLRPRLAEWAGLTHPPQEGSGDVTAPG
ncbi:MAG TPA: hypothetical protein VMH37_01975 [Candidatus Binataceae bacterium]|nr:hypothetical protein [Candidatus Binataceae bacterium]